MNLEAELFPGLILLDTNVIFLGILPCIFEALQKYDISSYFDQCFTNSVFLSYSSWKAIIKSDVCELENSAWNKFVHEHHGLDIAKSCLEVVPPQKFLAISDLVFCLHVQN